MRLVVGVDGSVAARAALAWAAELRRAGPCDVTAVYVAAPREEHARLGVPGPCARPRFRATSARAPGFGGEPDDACEKREAALRALVPPEAAGREVETTVVVVDALEPTGAILAAAERVGADALCLATRARQGFARAVVGSVAPRVLANGRRPVFLAPPAAERAWAP